MLLFESVMVTSLFTLFCFITRKNFGILTDILCVDFSILIVLIIIRIILTTLYFMIIVPRVNEFILQTMTMSVDVMKIYNTEDCFNHELSIFNFLVSLLIYSPSITIIKLILFYKALILFFGCISCIVMSSREQTNLFDRIAFVVQSVVKHHFLGNPDEIAYMIMNYSQFIKDHEAGDNFQKQDTFLEKHTK